MFDGLRRRAGGDGLPAREILLAVLDLCNGIWPNGLTLDGVALGDVGRHPALEGDDAAAGLMPFHKLSQWLSYSLVEPLEEAGIAVTALDQLTGLAEYRNGGLFMDTGVLLPRDPDLPARPARPDRGAAGPAGRGGADGAQSGLRFAAAGGYPAGRHLGRGPPAGRRTAWRPAAADH